MHVNCIIDIYRCFRGKSLVIASVYAKNAAHYLNFFRIRSSVIPYAYMFIFYTKLFVWALKRLDMGFVSGSTFFILPKRSDLSSK